ncbi:MAG: PTS fructose transporter subunit IIA [Desulfobacteraceae bacterium]|nr:MAG: PTS fructose transporter subunit IIA [Desulfobacteraceae bacterium]
MIGIVIVTHKQLGDALIDAAEFILGARPEGVVSVSININENADKLRGKISEGIKNVNMKEGVLILTDMFGGTPSNLSYSFLEEGRTEVISGVNLPILIKAVNTRKDMDISKLAQCIEAYGKKSISLASGILKGNKRC